jgi:16S rRNA (adenine1518-N6/adenine1519-N6)-dimethyltransferase
MSISPKKSLGQHFLTDKNIISKIVQSVNVDDDGRLIEIGPGTGAITADLFEKYTHLEVIEIDPRSVEYLHQRFPDLIVHQQDVLKTEWKIIGSDQLTTAESKFDKTSGSVHSSTNNSYPESNSITNDVINVSGSKENQTRSKLISVVGNLPYYITSPILFSVIDNRDLFREAVFMMQKEVAERLVAKPRTKAYGILSVQTQIWSNVEYLFTVSRHVFYPKPNVESAVVKLRFNTPVPQVDPIKLKLVIRTAFNQRRKTLNNALKTLLNDQMSDGTTRQEFAEKWQLNRRAEELTPQEFVELTNSMYKSEI